MVQDIKGMVVSCVETTHNDFRLAVEGRLVELFRVSLTNYIRWEFKIMRLGNTNPAFSLTTAWRRHWRLRETALR